MILSDHNLYGWGASNIDMPRVVLEPHPHRSRKSGEIAYGSRGVAAVCRWHAYRVSRIFLQDCPWGHTFVVGAFSFFVIAYFFMLNRTMTFDRAKAPTRPVKIVVAIQKEEPQQPVIPEAQPPVIKKRAEPDLETVKIETAKKVPPKVIVEKTKKIQPEIPKELPPETALKRKYTQKDTTEKMQPTVAGRTADFTSREHQKLNKDSPVQIRKKYALQDHKKGNYMPQRRAATNLYAYNQPEVNVYQTLQKSKIASRRYASKTNALLPAGKTPPLSTNQQIEFTGSQSGGFQQPAKCYTFNNKQSHLDQVPVSASHGLSFPSQKRPKNEMLTFPVTHKLIAKTKQPAGKSARAVDQTHNFSDTVSQDEIDPSQLVSLQSFNVCKDPEMEFQQKTQIAAHLLHATRIEAEGMGFFVKYTESGYTIQVHVYNPYGRVFKDRCEVLDLALDCIINRLN